MYNKTINGAEHIINALQASGVEICFTNPGTSEIHLVAALDQSSIRSVLCLFEGVATGAADGYARIAGKPATTLLHLGPGLANGIANLHNAQKANSPIINLIGQHSLKHLEHNTPLRSDITALAKSVSGWVKTIGSCSMISECISNAVQNTKSSCDRISTIIIPTDIAWGDAVFSYNNPEEFSEQAIDLDKVKAIAKKLITAKSAVVFINTKNIDKKAITLIGKIQSMTGCRIFSELFVSKITKGAGEVVVERIPFRQKDALATFQNIDEVILIGADHPRTFFAYPDQNNSSMFCPECQVTSLVDSDNFTNKTINALVSELGANLLLPQVSTLKSLHCATGDLTTRNVGISIAALLPENAIVSDDGITSTFDYWPLFVHSNKHDWLYTTGGSIGQGMPVAIGAALAAPDRTVICLSGDGSAMYTIQSLWTQVRENLNITNIIFSNRSYKILNAELTMVGIDNIGDSGKQMLDLSNPDISFKSLAVSMGMAATCVTTMQDFNQSLKNALKTTEPTLIEVIC